MNVNRAFRISMFVNIVLLVILLAIRLQSQPAVPPTIIYVAEETPFPFELPSFDECFNGMWVKTDEGYTCMADFGNWDATTIPELIEVANKIGAIYYVSDIGYYPCNTGTCMLPEARRFMIEHKYTQQFWNIYDIKVEE